MISLPRFPDGVTTADLSPKSPPKIECEACGRFFDRYDMVCCRVSGEWLCEQCDYEQHARWIAGRLHK